MKKLLLICLPLLSIMAMAQTDEAAKYAQLITKQGLKQKLTIVASAEMEGRETASPGQRRAAVYIEEQFKKLGLKPGNGNSYQQLYPLYRDVLTDRKLSVNGRPFVWDKDFSFSVQGMSNGSQLFNSLVFAGYGIVDSASKVNDYTGLDVKGKVIMVLDGGTTPAGGSATSISTFGKMEAARKAGAAGLLIVSPNQLPRKTPTSLRDRMRLQPAVTPLFIAVISDEVASALLGRTAKIPFAELKDINKGNYTAELKILATKTTENLESSNVIGVLPGTDKKDEYVFITAHYDHLEKQGDIIYYGADDDGSGTVSVIQMAEAFTAAAKKGKGPRRSIIFMTVSGEEKGLLGSEYYSEHPTIDLTKATVDLNIDMVGRTDTERKTADTLNYVYVIGHDKLSSDLVVINEGVNKKYTNLVLDYKYDDPADKTRIYFRSDHYNFARKGVPILFFYDGMLLADYHKPTDTIEKINFELMEKRARMIFHTGWEIANRDNMLKRDIPLNMGTR